MNRDRAWLERMAALEDDQTVSVGGWVTDLEKIGLGSSPARPTRSAFTRLLRLARRERALTMEAFAQQAGVDLAELVRIEQDPEYLPARQTVFRIARFLQLPESKLLVLAGLTTDADAAFSEAATRFAARSEPVQTLTPEEREALTEFVGFLGRA